MPGLALRRCGKVAIGSDLHLSTACTAALFRHFRYSALARGSRPERNPLLTSVQFFAVEKTVSSSHASLESTVSCRERA